MKLQACIDVNGGYWLKLSQQTLKPGQRYNEFMGPPDCLHQQTALFIRQIVCLASHSDKKQPTVEQGYTYCKYSIKWLSSWSYVRITKTTSIVSKCFHGCKKNTPHSGTNLLIDTKGALWFNRKFPLKTTVWGTIFHFWKPQRPKSL